MNRYEQNEVDRIKGTILYGKDSEIETIAKYIKAKNGNIYSVSTPFLYDVILGNIPNTSTIYQLGYNGDVDNIREDLWELGGTYVFPPVGGIQMAIVSSSSDDSSNGLGARTVDIHYLDSSFNEESENITLNGITPVNTIATDILRINDMHVMSVGSNEVSVGNLSLTNTTQIITYAYIAANGNASRQAIYTVPLNKTFYITDWQVGIGAATGNKFGEFTLRSTTSRGNEYIPGVFHFKDIIVVQDGNSYISFLIPIKCLSRTDIKISVVSDSASANSICSGHFSGWLQNN